MAVGLRGVLNPEGQPWSGCLGGPARSCLITNLIGPITKDGLQLTGAA